MNRNKAMLTICIWMMAITQCIAQKPHKYTTKNKSESTAFDSIMKQCFKNNTLQCDSCDTMFIRGYLNDQLNLLERNEQRISKLCTFMNIYHAWLLLTLCSSHGLTRLGNDSMFLSKDTIFVQQSWFTLNTLRAMILEMGQKDRLELWCSLWNGTVSGASPPKKEMNTKNYISLLKAKSKAFFKSSPDEYSLDRSRYIINISETFLKEIAPTTDIKKDSSFLLELIVPYIPETDAAFCMIHKAKLRIHPIVVSDRISIRD
ncbi:DUF547 domain-containing protein [bacterium]|nr:DUF547 domain-containing protein [bacterium]